MLKNISLIAIILFSLISCSNDKITLVTSTGRINHVLIVIKNSSWQGEIGDSLREIIAEPVVGLPQEEIQFSITQVPPQTFNNLFKRTRNILFVGIDSVSNFYTNHNVYASPQITLSILGKDKEDLIRNITSHKKEIITTFKNNDLILYQKKITKKYRKTEDIDTFNKHQFTLKIPYDYQKVEDNGDFLWYRNEVTKGQLNIIAYTIPLDPNKNINDIDVVKIRDSIGKLYIPGQFKDTYIMTEPKYKPITEKVVVSGLKGVETRGLWIVKNDYMGGPFISYLIEDKKNNQYVIVEGFSYSPAAKKRDFIFELEALLKTISFV